MRSALIFISILLFLFSCKKEAFTSEPRISYISISPNTWTYCNTCINGPLLRFRLTDLEGDFGFADTAISFVYVKNVADTLNSPDSIPFPPITIADKQRLDVEVTVDVGNVLPPPSNMSNHTDTLYFEVYVKDFANHKSNVIRTTDPLFFYTP